MKKFALLLALVAALFTVQAGSGRGFIQPVAGQCCCTAGTCRAD